MWFYLDQKFDGVAPTLGVPARKPATVYESNDQNAVSLNVCVPRNF
jgi:hypothetical protein